MACVQILVVGGFRLGLSEAAVDELYQEGSELAERAGNVAIVFVLRAAYGARLVGLGRIREYVDLMLGNLRTAEQVGVRQIRAGARLGASYATFLVGRLGECATHIDEGLELIGSDFELGLQEFGFSYLVFLVTVRAAVMGIRGKLVDAGRALVQALRLARDSGIPENLGWTLGNLAFHAEYMGELVFDELGDARAAAIESLRIADDLGSTFSRAIGYSQMGVVHLVAGEWEVAEQFFLDALDLMRTRRIRLESEAAELSRLARAQLGSGKLEAARTTAEESVALARERGQRLWELMGQIALAEALSAEQGGGARAAVEQALKRATDLVAETDGRVFEPWIAEARARLARACADAGAAERHLREAHRLYAAIGATGHVRRVARELDAS